MEKKPCTGKGVDIQPCPVCGIVCANMERYVDHISRHNKRDIEYGESVVAQQDEVIREMF